MSKDEKKIDPLADDTPDKSPATDSAIPPEIAAELDEEKIEPLADDSPNKSSATDSTTAPEIAAELDEDEKEFRALRRDLPGVKGASAAGIVAISVGKAPAKNDFSGRTPSRIPTDRRRSLTLRLVWSDNFSR